MKNILVATDKKTVFEAVRDCFASEYRTDRVLSRESCLETFRKRRYELTFVDVDILQNGGSQTNNGSTGFKVLLQPFWQVFPTAEIVVMAPQERIREAVLAVKAGASNYITYPIHADELRHLAESIYQTTLMRSELDYLRDRFWQNDLLAVVKTENLQMQRVFERIRALAPTQTAVLLSGETGTGKGVMAKLIHRHSTRADAQFITVHCGAIPDTLIESELFGHEKGSFTGADRRRLGKFEIAHGGTIFLDEIGTLTPPAQIKLLQVLQEKSFQRVGGESDIHVDVRMIFATNADLNKMTEEGLFRKDLYYRLSVFPIAIPSLRERKEDIPHLTQCVLDRLNRLNSKEIGDVDARVLDAFETYPWPGNIREMENLMERAYIIETSPVLTPESFPSEIFSNAGPKANSLPDVSLTLNEYRQRATEMYLRNLLAHYRGHIRKSAESAGISTRQMNKLMGRFGLDKRHYKTPSS
ncbi:MAG: sigma-54-dependent Fis family transcriptional regulator [Deltaproteobacteria bacterium]|nr:sigma-54-dependent Fis family transcriptional regulator [Deltaproteobacteria bacterium]